MVNNLPTLPRTTTSSLDPVQGLIDYVLEIKPYHTKIMEVLVDYIHTDCINTKITEALDFCIGISVPGYNSRFSFSVVGVDPATKSFVVSGDVRYAIFSGQHVQLVRSIGNDGYYMVSSVVFNATLQQSTLIVTTSIPSNVIGGSIVDNVILFCPEGGMYASYVAPPSYVWCDGGFGTEFDSMLGFDGLASCSSVSEGFIDTTIREELSFNFELDFQDSIATANWENTDPRGFGIDPFGIVFDSEAPTNPLHFDIGVAYADNIGDLLHPLIIEHPPLGISNELVQSNAVSAAPTTESPSASVTDNISFAWGNIDQWFQFAVVYADAMLNTFTLAGDATGDIQPGQQIEIIGATSNVGIYTVALTGIVITGIYPNIYTTIPVIEPVPVSQTGGYVEPLGALPAGLVFADNVGTVVTETATGEVLTTAGSLIGSWDYPMWDVGGFDENLGTIIIL